MNMKKLCLFLSLSALFFLSSLQAQQGLKGDYYNGKDLHADKWIMTRIDPQIDFDWQIGTSPAKGISPHVYSIRWTGKLQAPVSGTYTFSAKVDDGIRVWVGNIQVLDAWGMHDSEDFSGTIALDAGKKYDLRIEYFNGLREGEIHLLWETPNDKTLFFGHNYKPISPQFLSQPSVIQSVVSLPAKPTVATKPPPAVKKPIIQSKSIVSPKKPIPPLNLDTATKFIPKHVLFEKSKPIMKPESFEELDNLVAMLKRFPNKKVIVEGHTDNVGDSALNLKLSEERASAVVDYLIKKGIKNDRLTWKGYGDMRPMTTEDTAEGHSKNRRVEFIIK